VIEALDVNEAKGSMQKKEKILASVTSDGMTWIGYTVFATTSALLGKIGQGGPGKEQRWASFTSGPECESEVPCFL
jgi:hypothetical protein